MSVAVEVWMRKPFFVEAIQVTEENIEAIAEWCNGRLTPIKKEGDGNNVRFIKVNVKNPMTAAGVISKPSTPYTPAVMTTS